MAVADTPLINQAVADLGLVDLGPIGAVGGQKAVRKVEQNGEQFVLKVVAVDFTASETLKRAEREVQLLGEIASDNVVKVTSDLAEIGNPVRGAAWTEEYLDGDDLSALLGARQWTWAETRDMGEQVANGLAQAHAAGVIHRDLSANNVRRTSGGVYKVLDFGFARHTLRSGITVAGQPGTVGYLSPEHLNSYSGGPMRQSDVFQVGNLMYLALTGALPFPPGSDDFEYTGRLVRGTYAPLGSLRPDLAPEQRALVTRALHIQPARRHLDGAALREALEATP